MADESPRIMAGKPLLCRHFNGRISGRCRAGVDYSTVEVAHEPITIQRRAGGQPRTLVMSLPCINIYNLAGATCAKCEMPTEEELAAEDAADKKRTENIVAARAAIVKSLGGPWKRGQEGKRGAVDCPVCGRPNGLRFSRSGYNGQINAACQSTGCVSWLE